MDHINIEGLSDYSVQMDDVAADADNEDPFADISEEESGEDDSEVGEDD
jgi:hypothetical protein